MSTLTLQVLASPGLLAGTISRTPLADRLDGLELTGGALTTVEVDATLGFELAAVLAAAGLPFIEG